MTFLKLTYYNGCLLLLISFFSHYGYAASLVHKNIEQEILTELSEFHPSAFINIVFNLPNTQKKFSKCESFQLSPIKKITSGGKFSLRFNCTSANWSTYITFQASISYSIAVAIKPITKGQKIGSNNVKFVLQDITKSTKGYFKSPENLFGQDAKRAIRSTEIITPYMLTPPVLINKGDSIMIQAGSGGLIISTIGTALQNGKKGKQIRVKNNRSGKTIRAYVSSRGLVTTRP